MGISAGAGNEKTGMQLEGDALSIKAEPEGASNSICAAAKDAETKKAADAGSLVKAETLASGAMQAAAPQGKDATISASGKKKELEKTGLEGGKNAGNPAETQVIESALDTGKKRISTARTWKGSYASARDAREGRRSK